MANIYFSRKRVYDMVMPAKTIYCHIEDDLKKISGLLEQETSEEVVLVLPKRSYLFGDSLNLKLLKKHADLSGKRVSIMTADERGQIYARDAGFLLKNPPVVKNNTKPDDITKTMASFGNKITLNDPPSKVRAVMPQQNFRPSPKIAETEKVEYKKPSIKISHKAPPPQMTVQDTVFPDVSGITELLDKQKRKEQRRGGWTLTICLGLIIGLVLGIFIGLPEAEVVVQAKSQEVGRGFEIKLIAGTESANSDLSVASQVMERTMDNSDKFSSSGKREIGSKARGKIRIINITGNPINLKTATTTINNGNKTYKLVPEIVSIPNITQAQSEKENSGTEVEIVAENAGAEQNIPAGVRMEVNNQIFGSRPQVLFAKTSTEVTGGNSRFISFITEADLLKAKDALVKNTLANLQSIISQEGMSLSQKTARTEILEFSSDKPANTESPTFNANLKVKIRTVAFENARLFSILRARMEKLPNQEEQLQDPKDDILTFSIENLPDEKGNATLNIQYTSRIQAKVDKNQITSSIWLKNASSAQNTLENLSGIENAQINLKNSIFNYLPILKTRINVKIEP